MTPLPAPVWHQRRTERITPGGSSPAGATGGLPGGGGKNPRGVHEGSVPWARAHASPCRTHPWPDSRRLLLLGLPAVQLAGRARRGRPGRSAGLGGRHRGPCSPHSRLEANWTVGHRHQHCPPPHLLLHLGMRRDQGPDTTMVTDNCSRCVLWAYCVLGPVDREVGKSLPHMAHSGPKNERV